MDDILENFIDEKYPVSIGTLLKNSYQLLSSMREDIDPSSFHPFTPGLNVSENGEGDEDGLRDFISTEMRNTLTFFGVTVNPNSSDRNIYNLLALLDELPDSQLLQDAEGILEGDLDSVEKLCELMELRYGISSAMYFDVIHGVEEYLIDSLTSMTGVDLKEVDEELLELFLKVSKDRFIPLALQLYRKGVVTHADFSFYRMLGTLVPEYFAEEVLCLTILHTGGENLRETALNYFNSLDDELGDEAFSITRLELLNLFKELRL